MPRFEHDCNCCKSLGEFNEFDLYFCEQKAMRSPTVIARFGIDGAYKSGLAFADRIPEIGEARRRAQSLGLLK